MSKISRTRFLSLTGGRSLFCLYIDHLGLQEAAITDQLAHIKGLPLEAEITADNFPKLIAYLKVFTIVQAPSPPPCQKVNA